MRLLYHNKMDIGIWINFSLYYEKQVTILQWQKLKYTKEMPRLWI